ncbi:MAG TPA: hypothetical protein VIO32_09325 [Candidatus Baltobacteraceae bacterium]
MRHVIVFLTACMLLGASPSPSPRPALTAFSGTGRLTSQVEFTGKSMGLQADVAMWARPGLVRLDLQKMALSSQDPSQNALLTQLLPTGGVTALFNLKTQMMTVWSSQSHSYYTSTLNLLRPKSKPSGKPKPKATPAPNSPMNAFLKGLDSMTQYDVYSETIELTGHQPVNGHMASVFHFISKTQKHGGKLETINGNLALADDLSGIPLQLALDATGSMTGTMKMDLLTFAPSTPALSLFSVPAGYTKAKSILDVVMRK